MAHRGDAREPPSAAYHFWCRTDTSPTLVDSGIRRLSGTRPVRPMAHRASRSVSLALAGDDVQPPEQWGCTSSWPGAPGDGHEPHPHRAPGLSAGLAARAWGCVGAGQQRRRRLGAPRRDGVARADGTPVSRATLLVPGPTGLHQEDASAQFFRGRWTAVSAPGRLDACSRSGTRQVRGHHAPTPPWRGHSGRACAPGTSCAQGERDATGPSRRLGELLTPRRVPGCRHTIAHPSACRRSSTAARRREPRRRS
jgi:hypothetical protein